MDSIKPSLLYSFIRGSLLYKSITIESVYIHINGPFSVKTGLKDIE